jgi:aminopeptidase N
MIAGNEIEMPLIVPSFLLRGPSYRISAYSRSSVAYDMLYDLLGKDLFKKALHQYMDLWKGKHPIPWDFFNCFNSAVGENLNWFFKPWFFDFTYPDLGLKSYKKEKNKIKVVVEKIGGLPLPIKLKFLKENKVVKDYYFKADVWKNRNQLYEIVLEYVEFDEIILGDENIPDVKVLNNVLKY